VTWERIHQHNRNLLHTYFMGQPPTRFLVNWMEEQMAWLRYASKHGMDFF
jgi:hypothetical protein